nr:uncharacterized protein LOC109180802 isoform X1 [Ipomoea batatas]
MSHLLQFTLLLTEICQYFLDVDSTHGLVIYVNSVWFWVTNKHGIDIKVDLPIGKAVKTLVRLGIVVAENSVDGDEVLRAIPCLRAREILKQRWNSLVR